MLVISRKFGQRIRIGPPENPVWVTILGRHGTRGGAYNIGIDAPRSTLVVREEIIWDDQPCTTAQSPDDPFTGEE